MVRLRYVNKDHGHRLYGQEGECLVRSRGRGIRNQLVELDSGEMVVAPWGNWRAVKNKKED